MPFRVAKIARAIAGLMLTTEAMIAEFAGSFCILHFAFCIGSVGGMGMGM
jgi:hypothetical protein